MRVIPYLLAAAALASGCKTMSLDARYTRAIEDAMYPDSQKVDYNLLPVTRQTPNTKWKTINGEDYVLAVTWTNFAYPPAGSPYQNGRYNIWVTIVPQLQQAVNWNRTKNIGLRLQQLLGMPPAVPVPDSQFVELWVRPADLFRPCPNKTVTETSCKLCFSAADSADADHIRWMTKQRLANYNCQGLYNHYPWTGLGYTYDWNPGNVNHHGLSEFVVGTNKTLYVERIVPTAAYVTGRP